MFSASDILSLGKGSASDSGQECDPSKEDIHTTNKIRQALKYVDVPVLDHIIVGCIRQNVFGFAKVGVVEDTQVGRTPRSTG
jgi:hypothetical protein